MIIFLNGTSSAGKTSTAKKIQELYPKPMLHMGIDHFFFSVDPRFMGEGQESHLGYQFIRVDDSMGAKIVVKKGPFAKQLSQSLHRALRVVVDHQIPLIIDDLLFIEDDFRDYLNLFEDREVFFIALKPSKEVLERREQQRGDRGIGLARGLYQSVYEKKIFDLVIDTSHLMPEESAKIILDYIQANPHPTAFQKNANKALPSCGPGVYVEVIL